jgi:ppGpp synthetase/RelA/SpoT-type nucleotidyltranferase
MKNEAFLAELAAHQPSLDALREHVQQQLRTLLDAQGVEVQFVTSRTKSADSLRRKIARPDKTYAQLWDVTDLIGIRIATYFEDTIDAVARLIEQSYRVDFAQSTDKLRFTDHGRFGYRSLHYICVPPEHSGLDKNLRFEVQVRTALQHAWAEVEHDLGYKASESVPEVIRRRFSRIASLLEIADQEFVSIRTDLKNYREQVRSELNDPSRPLPLDIVSLAEVIRTDAVRALDERLARLLGLPLIDEPWSPGYLLALLRLARIRTTRELLDAVAVHGDDALRIVAAYFAFAGKHLNLDVRSLGGIASGYALFFVAHVVMLHGSDLGISKVSRMAKAYLQLDYPNDPKTALKIAGGLAETLGAALEGAAAG